MRPLKYLKDLDLMNERITKIFDLIGLRESGRISRKSPHSSPLGSLPMSQFHDHQRLDLRRFVGHALALRAVSRALHDVNADLLCDEWGADFAERYDLDGIFMYAISDSKTPPTWISSESSGRVFVLLWVSLSSLSSAIHNSHNRAIARWSLWDDFNIHCPNPTCRIGFVTMSADVPELRPPRSQVNSLEQVRRSEGQWKSESVQEVVSLNDMDRNVSPSGEHSLAISWWYRQLHGIRNYSDDVDHDIAMAKTYVTLNPLLNVSKGWDEKIHARWSAIRQTLKLCVDSSARESNVSLNWCFRANVTRLRVRKDIGRDLRS